MINMTAIGTLGRDAEVSEHNGKHVINFSIAHSEKYKDQEKTVWISCAYWTEKLGIVPFLKKGQQIYVDGTPDIRVWEKDGKSGSNLTCRVISVQLIGKRDENQQPTSQQAATVSTVTSSDDDIQDLPF